MNANSITWVGLDAHKNSIKVAAYFPEHAEAVEWSEATTAEAIRRLGRRLRRDATGAVRCCYEAGPTGYGLQRQLGAHGSTCTVIAPSLTPVKPGSRIKTDRRDARKLAELHRAGLLTEVHPPSESDEALRDLCRCRDDVRVDLLRARHRLSKFLLRRHVIYRQTKHHWGTRHWAWLEQLRFDDPMSQATFDSYMLAVRQLEERQQGLVPSECSSGERERRGSITRAGNRHVRRLLVEAAWHHRHRPMISRPLQRRREGQPARILAIADRAQERLCARYRRMTLRGISSPKTIVAMARELTGYLWAALHPAATTTRA